MRECANACEANHIGFSASGFSARKSLQLKEFPQGKTL